MSEINITASDRQARRVADYIIGKGIERGKPYKPLSVIKLTYLAHGWMLGLYNREMFGDRVEAWPYGPVIPDVYHNVREYKGKPIKKTLGFGDPELDAHEEDIIRQVLDVYKDFSPQALSTITHQEGTPWHTVWNENGQNAFIPNTVIRDHFAELAENNN